MFQDSRAQLWTLPAAPAITPGTGRGSGITMGFGRAALSGI